MLEIKKFLATSLVKGLFCVDLKERKRREINPFVLNKPFPYPLKTSENRKTSWCFLKGTEGVDWEQMG